MQSSLSYSSIPSRSPRQAVRPQLFVLDSNPEVLRYMCKTIGDEYDLSLFDREEDLIEALGDTATPDLILLEWESVNKSMPVLSHIRSSMPDIPIVMLSCTSDVRELQLISRIGARGTILKPFIDGNLEESLREYLSVTVETPSVVEPEEIALDEGHSFVLSSRRMGELRTQAALVARSDIPVLILGESGTGKEILALYTHKMSARSHRMFLKVNCAAMPAELLESELFGYEQGAFTGAVKAKPGKFEICSGGTIFLDEIGEMPAVLQAKLLQVLQDGTFSRLGSRAPTRVDVRVIAATNIDMKAAIARRSFREDLYYRLNGFSISIPPLNQRLEEIPILANYFMRKAASRYGKRPLSLSKSLLDAFGRYAWPGNLRELENIVNRYFILGDERPILTELNRSTHGYSDTNPMSDAADGAGLKQIVRSLKGEAEAAAIAHMLEVKGWNRKAAASELQISYKALLYKIKQYDLAPKRA
jgi:two-component system, NtrC family, response regulator AtoC